jgi:DUF1365 family protein
VESCLYEGQVEHRRVNPRPHRFAKRLLMAYLDLDELEEAGKQSALLRCGRFGWASFHRPDHFGDPERPLAPCARDLVEERTGQRPEGPVFLLTNPRHFGVAFNPVSFYYCFASPGGPLQALVAEVNNTPWGERHCYVLAPQTSSDEIRSRTPKTFHVSPFMPMEQSYDWVVHRPEERLRLAIVSKETDANGKEQAVFTARLRMQRLPLRSTLAWLRFPGLTLQIVIGIYFQALRLWWKRIPIHPHPRRRERPLEGAS